MTGRRSRGLTIAGLLLIAAGCVGFVTVADDLRHTGELFGVGGILAIGLVLMAAESDLFIARRPALRWIAVGLGAGLLAGSAMDGVATGLVCGGVLGALASVIRSTRMLSVRK